MYLRFIMSMYHYCTSVFYYELYSRCNFRTVYSHVWNPYGQITKFIRPYDHLFISAINFYLIVSQWWILSIWMVMLIQKRVLLHLDANISKTYRPTFTVRITRNIEGLIVFFLNKEGVSGSCVLCFVFYHNIFVALDDYIYIFSGYLCL